MGDLEWPRELYRIITKLWGPLKNTLVLKDIVDPLIQGHVITLEYWMHLKTKPITESERMEDFLALLMKFDQKKYQLFLEALLSIQRKDLVKELLNVQRDISKSSSTKSSSSSSSRSSKKKIGAGQTDADQMNQVPQKPVIVRPKQTLKPSVKPSESSSETGSWNTVKSEKLGSTQTTSLSSSKQGNSHADSIDKMDKTADERSITQGLGSTNQMSATDKLHLGIGTVDKVEGSSAPQSTSKNDRKETKANIEQQNNTVAIAAKLTKTDKPKASSSPKSPSTDKPVSPSLSLQTTIRDSDSVRTSRPNTAKSKEEILEEREQLLETRESELLRREDLVKEKEEQLQKKETELIDRENTMSTIHSTTAETLETHVKMFKDLQQGTASASSTTDSAVLADVRAQMSEMKYLRESEPSNCNTPHEEYVKMKDFVSSQNKIEGLREEIATDRSNMKAIKENLQHKVEDLKHEISELKLNIDQLEKEKKKTKTELSEELSKLKAELVNNKRSHDGTIAKIKNSIKAKDQECAELKTNIEDVVKTATDLEERVENLENEKSKQKHKLTDYEKEISFLRKEVQEKKTKIIDLKKILEQTENEKEELIEDLTGLKKEVSNLKAEKRQLESDKRSLLARCAKPQWSHGTRKSGFQK